MLPFELLLTGGFHSSTEWLNLQNQVVPLLDDLHLVDQICDQFELAWKSKEAERPLLSHFLATGTEETKPQLLLSLMAIELWWRMKAGQSPQIADYESLIPEYEEQLNAVFCSEKEAFAKHLSRLGSNSSLGVSISPAGQGEGDPWPSVYLRAADNIRGDFRYKLLNVIGRGQFGVLFLAFDQVLERRVAIKVLSPEVVIRFGGIDRCLHEARTIAKLKHPNIVAVHDAGTTDDGVVFLVFHYVEGTALSNWVSDHRLSVQESVRLVHCLALALTEAHQLGIVHRDVKPANVLVESETNEVYLVDFGLAIALDKDGDGSGVFGTPAYMSPEQARSEKVTSFSDQYSLGVILYELLTGRLPSYGASVQKTIESIVSQPVVSARSINPDIPSGLDKICSRVLAKLPEDRFETTGQFASALANYLSPIKSERYAGVTRRGVLATAVFGGAVVGAMTSTGLLLNSQGDSEAEPAEGLSVSELLKRCDLLVNRAGGPFYPANTMWPLQKGDSVRFEIELTRAAHVKIIWVSGIGDSSQIYPLEGFAGEPPTPVLSVLSPNEVDSGWPLEGDPGIESAWILISEERPIKVISSDLTIPSRGVEDYSRYRSIAYDADSGVVVDYGDEGSGTRSLGGASKASSGDVIRKYLEALKEQFDAIRVFDLPYDG